MRHITNTCPNGCALPHSPRLLSKNDSGEYHFVKRSIPFCPKCGAMTSVSINNMYCFFETYRLNPLLKKAQGLLYKSEFESAAREAAVTLETVLREKSGLDLHGTDLAIQALKFEYDKQSKTMKTHPIIAVNQLKNDSDRNEQDGLKYSLMGFFQGQRNLYQHNHIGSGASNAITMVLEASMYLNQLDGHSISKNGKWIRVERKVDFYEILHNMPLKRERLYLIWRLYLNKIFHIKLPL